MSKALNILMYECARTVTKVTKTITIKAPIEEVFKRVEDPNGLPLYVPAVTNVSDVRRSEKGIGDTFRATYSLLGVHFDEDFTFTEYKKGARITARFDGSMSGTMGITLEPTGSATKATLEYDWKMPAGVLGKLANTLVANRINEKNAERLLENLKIVCESR